MLSTSGSASDLSDMNAFQPTKVAIDQRCITGMHYFSDTPRIAPKKISVDGTDLLLDFSIVPIALSDKPFSAHSLDGPIYIILDNMPAFRVATESLFPRLSETGPVTLHTSLTGLHRGSHRIQLGFFFRYDAKNIEESFFQACFTVPAHKVIGPFRQM